MVAGTEKQDSSRGWVSGAAHWRWAKAAVALVLAGVAGLIGWVLRPSAQEAARVVGPAIGIVANRRDVQASVGVVLTVGNSTSGQASALRLTITPTQASRPVTFTVTLSNFPRSRGPVPTGHRDHLSRPARRGRSRDTVARGGPQILGEDPGVRIPAAETDQTLYAGSATPPGFTRPAFGATLVPGLSTFTIKSRSAAPLSEFQVLSGDPPTTLLGSEWAWNGINGATVLAANVAAEDDAQVHLFWSGLALGLAGGALITAVLELLTVLGRKDPAGPAAAADQQPPSRSAR